MSTILDAAMTRTRAIKVVLTDGERTQTLGLLLPSGTDSVEFVQDSRPWIEEVGGDKNPQRMAEKLLEFAVKWLPRLCPDMEDKSPGEVSRAIANTGGVNSPLLVGLAKMVATGGVLGALGDEVLLDYPFE